MQVGDTIWIFDANHRVYEKTGGGGPIFREYFRPTPIFAETTRSWLISDRGRERKIDKKTLSGIWTSQQSVDEYVWIHDNAYFLGEHIRQLKDYTLLKQIAELTNYLGKV